MKYLAVWISGIIRYVFQCYFVDKFQITYVLWREREAGPGDKYTTGSPVVFTSPVVCSENENKFILLPIIPCPPPPHPPYWLWASCNPLAPFIRPVFMACHFCINAISINVSLNLSNKLYPGIFAGQVLLFHYDITENVMYGIQLFHQWPTTFMCTSICKKGWYSWLQSITLEWYWI